MESFITITKELLTRRFEKAFSGSKLFFAFFAPLHLCVFALIFFLPVTAQKVAILTPDKTEASRLFAEKLHFQLAEKLNILDDSLVEAAYLSVSPSTPFNLTTEEAKRIGSAIGCEFFIILKAVTQRRSAFQRAEFYESYAAIYVVSSRTGRLVIWRLPRFEASKPDKAEKMLADSVTSIASEIENSILTAMKKELAEPDSPAIEEVPDEHSPAAKNFRAPVPYRRIKPEYTAEAALYDVTATVDILIDLGTNGLILRTNIVRWAGFGLDESVEKAVRTMNWRSAERGGKPLAMRFLVRYNFKKIEKE